MGRFSLSSQQLKSLQDDDTDDDDTQIHCQSFREPKIQLESDDEEEDKHPLGFHPSASWGITKFCFEPPGQSHLELRRRYGWLDDDEDDWISSPTTPLQQQQQYPPLSQCVDETTAPILSLLQYHAQFRHRPSRAPQSVDTISEWLSSKVILVENKGDDIINAAADRAARHIQQVALKGAHDRDLIALKQQKDLQRAETAYQQDAQALKALLKRDQQDAKEILNKEREEQKRVDDEHQARVELDLKEHARIEAKEQARFREKQAKEQAQRDQEIQEIRKEQQRIEQEQLERQAEAKKMDYVHQARALVVKLLKLRESVEPFETSKAVGKRRLNMKKIVNGKVNTLSADPAKVHSVALEVVRAINAAKAEDEQMKENPQATPEMTRGTRYLIDLIASSAIVRVQAEGFNGPRGDGFPLANMLALVGYEANELVPVFSAHIYTVCPTAIPALPKPAKDADEVELMESLGMIRNKAGDFETFERFMARTEGIISIVADIMASQPSDHNMFGGHEGAIQWLQRFLEQLPKAPETLPLLTAPVLDAFLTGAGHMMARVFPDEFRPLLQIITQDLVFRLDEGPNGAPGALRFKKVVEGGFSAFHNNLPSRALHPLYYTGGSGGRLPHVTSMGSAPNDINSFGGTTSQPGNPFGQIAKQTFSSFSGSQNQAPTPFSGTTPVQASNTSMFAPAPSPFSAATTQTTSLFGAVQPPRASPSPFGRASSQTVSPFGAAPSQTQNKLFASVPTAFSETTTQTTSPFGVASSQTQNSMFAPAPNPFGGEPSQEHRPFGATTLFGVAQGPSSFGGPSQALSKTNMDGGFAPVITSAPSPFGSTPFNGNTQAPSPFGSSNGPRQSNSGKGKGPCRFFAQGKCRNGNDCPFSHDTLDGSCGDFQPQANASNAAQFGGQLNNAPFGQPLSKDVTPFGGVALNSPFGHQQESAPFGMSSNNTTFVQQSTPFGTPYNNTPFGQNQQQSTPFGRTVTNTSNLNSLGGGASINFSGNTSQGSSTTQGSNNPNNRKTVPCHFFAQGTCRNGDNCAFLHDTQGGTGGPSPFVANNSGNNNPFGGPRR